MSGTLNWTYSFVIPDQSTSGSDTLSVTFMTSAVVDPSMGGYLAMSVSGTVTGPGGASTAFSLLDTNPGFYGNDNYLFGNSADGLDNNGISFSVEGGPFGSGSDAGTFNIFDDSGSFLLYEQVPAGEGNIFTGLVPTTGPNGTGVVQYSLGTLLPSGSYSDQLLSGGDQSETLDSGTITDSTVTSGADLLVLGGQADSITVEDGSGLFIDGGSVSHVTLDTGGTIAIGGGTLTGGSFSALAISGTVALNGATLTASTIEAAAELNVYGGAASGLTVASGGSLTLGGGTVSDTSVDAGGTEYVVGGTNSGNIVEDGALQSIAAGATAFDSSVSSNATIGFYSGAMLDLTNETWAAGDQVVLSDDNGTETLTIETAGGETIVSFDTLLPDGVDGFAVVQGADNADDAPTLELEAEPVCYVAGTKIATERGEIAIESLCIGDKVITASGLLQPILWIGSRVLATRFADPLTTMPIRITAGALDDNVPARDVLLSPCHAVLVDGILAHAGALVNGITIRRETSMPEKFTYYHIELENHVLILAEGMAAETFIDNVDRMSFDNWADRAGRNLEDSEMIELPYPRAKSARQIPPTLRMRLASRIPHLQAA